MFNWFAYKRAETKYILIGAAYMGLFRKKKEMSEEERRYLLIEKKVTSREYKIFREKELKRLSFYERYANFSSSIIKVKPSGDSAKKLQAAINFTGLKITPTSVYSSFFVTLILFLILGISVMVLSGSFTSPLVIILAGVGGGYYFLKYPENQVKVMRIRASSQVVLAILYMVVSMRMSRNLERSLKFAAANISGELAWDMRRLVWDILMRKYNSAEDALSDYIVKWKPENEEFSESMRLVRDSQYQTSDRADATLDEALDVILEGTKTRMKTYTQDLRLPVMVIHMMGIILPVLGTIMAPMAAVFMGDVLQPHYFIIGYDVALPLFIMWFINSTLKKRPVTISEIDIGNAPGIPPKGTFFLGGKNGKGGIAFPALPLALIVGLLVMLPAIFYFSQNPEFLFPPEGSVSSGKVSFPVEALFMSLLVIGAVGLSLAIYFILTNFQSVKKQAEIEATEGQLELALFSLGNRIGSGIPVEIALEKAIPDIKDKEICGLYKTAVRNMKEGGMTLEDAFFHKTYGAIRQYPSKLIRNIIYAVVDTSKKGVGYTSQSMMTISKYMKNVRETQEYIKEILSDTTSSMKFQAYMLTPIITGLIVSMSQIIIQVLTTLGQKLATSGLAGGPLGGVSANLFGDVDKAMPPAIFQLIVGVYLIEVIVILAIFLTKISHGENKTTQWMLAGRMLIIGLVMYIVVALISSTMFVGLIGNALQSFSGGG